MSGPWQGLKAAGCGLVILVVLEAALFGVPAIIHAIT